MSVFFTSDLHFGHDRDFIYGKRGFESIMEHDEEIVHNWNQTVEDGDIVYVLGDLFMGKDYDYVKERLMSLNGELAFLQGNHDTTNKIVAYKESNKFNQLHVNYQHHSCVVKDRDWVFYLSHYPVILGDIYAGAHPSHHICLHGHTHSKDPFQFVEYGCYNVALDAHNNTPVALEDIKWEMSRKINELRQARAKIINN